VYGLVGGGALAEFVVVHARAVAAVPESLTWPEAAAVPEAFLTAYDALLKQGHLETGQTVLIHGATGGIGTAAVQIARASGAITIGTSRSDTHHDALAGLGLDHLITTTDGADFAPEVHRLTDGAGVHLILDVLGAGAWDANLASLRTDGRIVLIGLLTGAKAEVDLGQLLAKRARIAATTLRSRSRDAKFELTRILDQHIGPLIRMSRLRPVLDSVYPLDSIRDALLHLKERPHLGKIVIDLDNPRKPTPMVNN
jgi:NADPH:quinone reductase-like Zn-dependent oxidoreductase